ESGRRILAVAYGERDGGAGGARVDADVGDGADGRRRACDEGHGPLEGVARLTANAVAVLIHQVAGIVGDGGAEFDGVVPGSGLRGEQDAERRGGQRLDARHGNVDVAWANEEGDVGRANRRRVDGIVESHDNALQGLTRD